MKEAVMVLALKVHTIFQVFTISFLPSKFVFYSATDSWKC
jgi:hypothetical protein